MINLICAMNETYSIGKDSKLLYRIKKDLLHFKKLTENHTVIMGHNTFKEIGKALPNRKNIVLSSNSDLKYDNVLVCNNLFEAILNCEINDEIFIIGGSKLYVESLFFANRVYLTKIYDDIVGEVYFPYKTMLTLFKLNNESKLQEENGIKFKFKEYILK